MPSSVLRPFSTPRPSLAQNVSFQVSIQLSQTAWSEDLFNNRSSGFVLLATNLTTTISDILKTVGDARVEVLEFKPGSVIAVLKLTAFNSIEGALFKTKLESEMKDRMLGTFSVDPTLYVGTIFDVVIKVKLVCNNTVVDKGFGQKGDFVKAISSAMSSNTGFLGANIKRIECSEAGRSP